MLPVMDVASGEYGCYLDKLVTLTSNVKKSSNISKVSDSHSDVLQTYDTTYFNNDIPEYNCSTWKQFTVLLHRMFLQRLRDGVSII